MLIRQFALASVIMLVLGSALIADIATKGRQSQFSLEFNKIGGIAGLNQSLIITEDGYAIFKATPQQIFTTKLSTATLSELKDKLANNLARLSIYQFEARDNSVDYFEYSLNVTMNGETKRVKWVDEWASKNNIPDELKEINSILEKITQIIIAQSSYSNVSTRSVTLCSDSRICGNLTITIFTDKPSYKVGDKVSVFVMITNDALMNVTYISPTPCHPDIRIIVTNGSLIQDISFSDTNESLCALVLQERYLAPNQVITDHTVWGLKFHLSGLSTQASPGRYIVIASFPFAEFQPNLLSAQLSILVYQDNNSHQS